MMQSPDVAAAAAGYLRSLHCAREAEALYVGALLLDPHQPAALAGYARMLTEQGNEREREMIEIEREREKGE